jgi:uncharacterized alpha-E superfamily protein
MLSRIAESLYWIGRYVERAEGTARITKTTYAHTLAMGSSAADEERRRRQWAALIDIVGDPTFDRTVTDEDTVPPHLTYSTANPNSIVSCIAAARENARTMRHHIASEMWEALNRFYLELERSARRRSAGGDEAASTVYQSVTEFSHLFQGITDSTMPREEGWHFLQAGKFLERAEKTARALDVNWRLLAPPPGDEAAALFDDAAAADRGQWIPVLRSLSSYEAYYRVSNRAIQPKAVVELLTLSSTVPRSIRFSVHRVARALAHITEGALLADRSERPVDETSEARRAVGRLDAQLAYQRPEEIFERGLDAYLLRIQRDCYRIGEQIEDEYFAHRPLRAEEVVG